MTSDPRLHAGRRSRAIDRLRTTTTGVAVAGVAGTAAFGLLAAANWSGTPGATGAADVDTGPSATDDGGGDSFGATVPEPTFDAGDQGQPPTQIQPTRPGSGRSHATTGGSH
jgi:hypothetical protein